MIQQQTILKASDNSGAKTLKCIKVLGGYKKKTARLGDIIVVSIKELRNKSKKTSKVKKGEIYKALILKTKTKKINKDGSAFFFNTNSACLINKQKKPFGSRILSPIPKQFKKGKYSKFANISIGTV
jgi:large subunit ribosomal protein L14